MPEFDIIKWFLLGVLVGGVLVHFFWSTRFRDSLKLYANFTHYVRQGYSIEAAWRLANSTI